MMGRPSTRETLLLGRSFRFPKESPPARKIARQPQTPTPHLTENSLPANNGENSTPSRQIRTWTNQDMGIDKGKLGVLVFIFFASVCLHGQAAAQPIWAVHQSPDESGIYYAGPEVSAPRLVSVMPAAYPGYDSKKDRQGMTVLAMVIGVDGVPSHIQLLHSHGDSFDQAAIAAVQQSVFEPGKLAGKPVPVWTDVRVVFRANRAQALPEVIIAERDLPPPGESFFEGKDHRPAAYTPPVLIHTVDAGFADPFLRNPIVQVATVTVTVGVDGLPKAVQMRRGLGFGLDKKAIAAVWHDRFLPATKRGKPIEDMIDVSVEFRNL
jgi:TonB family protein